MFSHDHRKNDDKEPVTMGNRILGFCFAVFLGVVLLCLALELLSAVWGWLLLLAVIAAAIWILVAVYRHRHDGW